MKRIAAVLMAALAALAVLVGCGGGNKLPEGMAEDELLAAGRQVLLLLTDGQFDEVQAALRADVGAAVTAEKIGSLVLEETEGMGIYKEIDRSMTTGQTAAGEEIGVAVFYCVYAEGNVLYRISFDRELTLVGFSVKRQ